MKPTDELRYDHEALRGKLALLEERLPRQPVQFPPTTQQRETVTVLQSR